MSRLAELTRSLARAAEGTNGFLDTYPSARSIFRPSPVRDLSPIIENLATTHMTCRILNCRLIPAQTSQRMPQGPFLLGNTSKPSDSNAPFLFPRLAKRAFPFTKEVPRKISRGPSSLNRSQRRVHNQSLVLSHSAIQPPRKLWCENQRPSLISVYSSMTTRVGGWRSYSANSQKKFSAANGTSFTAAGRIKAHQKLSITQIVV